MQAREPVLVRNPFLPKRSFRHHRKLLPQNRQALLSNQPMLKLRFFAGTYLDVVNPAPQRPIHIHRCRRTQRQDPPRRFLRHPRLQHLVIQIEAVGNHTTRLLLQRFLVRRVNVVDTVLPILLVLPPKPGRLRRLRLGVTSRKFLEREGPVPRELAGYVPLSRDLDAHVRHLKRRPMLVLNQVPQQTWPGLVILRVIRIADPRHFDDHVLRFGRSPHQ